MGICWMESGWLAAVRRAALKVEGRGGLVRELMLGEWWVGFV